MKLEEIDPNLKQQEIGSVDLDFIPVGQKPIELDGLPFWEQEHKFLRIPEAEVPRVSFGVGELATNTSGVQARFRTDSPVLAIRAKLRYVPFHGKMPVVGSCGFDVYTGTGLAKRFLNAIGPTSGKQEYGGLCYNFRSYKGVPYSPMADAIPGTGLREVTINFPLYNGVDYVEIGLVPGARLEAPAPFSIEKPIVFYGSSITQGGCVSRPGNHYVLHISRRLDANVACQGYSGNAKGEVVMADIMSRIPMSVFVFDYDHNAPNIEHLKKTHYPFYRYFRERCPDVPIVFASNTSPALDMKRWYDRLGVIRETYERAYADGDRRIAFLDGTGIFSEPYYDACTVDGCHPNDLGFFRMADSFEKAIREALALI